MKRFSSSMVLMVTALAIAPASAQSLPEALEAIQQARVTTRILYVTAHPDDEPGGLLAYLSRGLGGEVALVSITRGEGGQNALGPEQGAQLGILRTEELLAATRAYGVKLYFTRAPDFGYSKTAEETLRIWGDSALDDLVRVIRIFRPQVVINNWGGVHGGHGHHQSAGLLTPKAFAAAADPKAFPQQLAEGLRPWAPTLLLQLSRGDASSGFRVAAEQISPIWGKSHNEFGREGFTSHRTQGVAAFLSSPFLRRSSSLVMSDGAKFDPVLLAEPLARLGAQLPIHNETVLMADGALAAAWEAALRLDWAAAVKSLAAAARDISAEKQALTKASDSAEDALRDELERVGGRIDAALVLAAAMRVEAQADRSEVVAGENFSVRVEVRRRTNIPGEFGKPSLVLPAGWSVAKEESDTAGGAVITVAIPASAKAPGTPNAWMLPWPAPLVTARVHAVIEGYAFDVEAPVMSQRASSTRVDTLPLSLVPAVTLALDPRRFVVVEKRLPKQMELLARVHHYGAAAAQVTVGLEVPAGWQASPPQAVEFTGSGDQLVRFSVTPAGKIAAGDYELKAYARRGISRPLPETRCASSRRTTVADLRRPGRDRARPPLRHTRSHSPA